MTIDTELKRILVISGTPLLREGLALLFESSVRSLVMTAENREQALQLMGEFRPDVVLLDETNREPGEHALQLDARLARVIVVDRDGSKLTVYYDEQVMEASIDNLVQLAEQHVGR